jgi:hypothetical protein
VSAAEGRAPKAAPAVTLDAYPGHVFPVARIIGAWEGYARVVMTRAQVRALEAVTGEDDAYWANPTPLSNAGMAPEAYVLDGLQFVPVLDAALAQAAAHGARYGASAKAADAVEDYPLSGEWADGATPSVVLALAADAAGIPLDVLSDWDETAILDAFCDAYAVAAGAAE